jgi:hypothetical protein
VIAVAIEHVWSQPNKQSGVADEDKLTPVGFVTKGNPASRRSRT